MAFLAIESSSLSGSAVTTTAVRQTDNRDAITGTVFADAAGSLAVEQGYADSSGTVHFDAVTLVTVLASTGNSFSVPVVAPNWRLTYTNGASAASVVRIFARTAATSDDA